MPAPIAKPQASNPKTQLMGERAASKLFKKSMNNLCKK
jgi:hypothetical protein